MSRSSFPIARAPRPAKPTLETHAGRWKRAIELGLPITPWTFRASTVKRYAPVADEMARSIAAEAAGVITDNPDLVPSRTSLFK